MSQARRSRGTLVCGRSTTVGTMMQSCASSAKLQGGGPILHRGWGPCAMSGCRHLGSCRRVPGEGAAELVVSPVLFSAIGHDAGCKTTPSGGSPVVTRRHSAISSLRASATIIVLRVVPRSSVVRARNQQARPLSFWNWRNRQANSIMPRRTRALPARARPFSRRRLPLSSGAPVSPA
jgi:hypothetical protein